MNTRTKKELRSLRSSFGMALLTLVVLSFLLNGHDAPGIVIMVFVGFCALLGAGSFGNEFDTRTMAALLSQPVSRRQIWFEKMRILALALGLSYGAVLLCLTVVHQGFLTHPENSMQVAGVLFFVMLGAFCTAPLWSLVTKNLIGAAVFTFFVPFCLVGIFFFICWAGAQFTSHPNIPIFQSQFENHPHWAIGIPSLIYCAMLYWLGYRTFLNFQAIDSQGHELKLPASWEKALANPLKIFVPGYSSPLSSLLRKELQVQRMNFFIAAFACLLFLGTTLAWKLHHSDYIQYLMVAEGIIYFLAIPLLVGTVSLAEERSWGTSGWQLTLPVSPSRQWSVKMLVTFLVVAVLGLALPAILLAASKWVFGLPIASLDPDRSSGGFGWEQYAAYVVTYFLVVNLIIFASSASTNSLRSILFFCGISVGIGMTIWLVTATVNQAMSVWSEEVFYELPLIPGKTYAQRTPREMPLVGHGVYSDKDMIRLWSRSNSSYAQFLVKISSSANDLNTTGYPLILNSLVTVTIIGLGILFALVNGMAFNNFRHGDLNQRQIWLRVSVILLYVAGLTAIVTGLFFIMAHGGTLLTPSLNAY